MLLSPSSIISNGQRAAMPCGWEGNRRSGVALAMRHRLQWFLHLRAHGLRKGDEHPAYTPHGVWHTFLYVASLCADCAGLTLMLRYWWASQVVVGNVGDKTVNSYCLHSSETQQPSHIPMADATAIRCLCGAATGQPPTNDGPTCNTF